MIKLIKEYPYLYETHLHTSESSACAKATGKEVAHACKVYGYTGVIVTNHNWYGNTAVDRSLSWTEWVDQFCIGYENTKREGKKIGLDVFFGYESNYQATEFLIYGVDGEWLKSHPEIKDASLEQQLSLIHSARGMVIHAHPFREEHYIKEIRLFPQWIDGVEGINATHSNSRSKAHFNPLFDEKAINYAKKYKLPLTAGSDLHNTYILGGGIAFRKKLTCIQDYIDAILKDGDYIITNGETWFHKDGTKYEG